jgi:hypothetical protein
MAPLVRTPTQARWEQMLAQFGKRSRSAASNLYPHLNLTHPPATIGPRPQGSAASRMYPHLPQSAAARMSQPKPRVRQRTRRRLYGDLDQ